MPCLFIICFPGWSHGEDGDGSEFAWISFSPAGERAVQKTPLPAVPTRRRSPTKQGILSILKGRLGSRSVQVSPPSVDRTGPWLLPAATRPATAASVATKLASPL